MSYLTGDVKTYTPAVTRSVGDPTLGTGSAQVGRYVQRGKAVTVWVNIKLGTTGFGAGSGSVYVSLPVEAKVDAAWTTHVSGIGYVFNGASTYATVVIGTDNSIGGTKCLLYTETALGTPSLGSNGAISFTMTYEAA